MRIIFLLLFCSSLCSAPKAIVFDFGRVIVISNPKPVHRYIRETLETEAEKDFRGDKLHLALIEGEDFWHCYADANDKLLSAEWFEGLNQQVDRFIQPIVGMQELIDELKEEGYQIALLSNATKARSTLYRNMGLYDPFELIVLSCECNVKKPHPKIYKILLENLNLPAEDCIFIDNRKENVEGARKVGIHAIHFQSAKQLKAQLQKILESS